MKNDWTTTQVRRFIYDVVVHNHLDFGNEWKGWRMRGRNLITPDGDRITPERLRGIIMRECWRDALDKQKARNVEAYSADNVVPLFAAKGRK